MSEEKTKEQLARERRREYTRNYRATHPEYVEKQKESSRKYFQEHKDALNEWHKKYYEAHKEKYMLYQIKCHLRKAVKLGLLDPKYILKED